VKPDLLLFAADLARQGEPFALATVVRREPPSSAQVGDTALITQGGAFHGWLGGSCTQPAVVREALQALAEGRPRLITLSPDPGAEARLGVTPLPMTCHSGGVVDIYIEPVKVPLRLVVFGISPVAQSLARLGKAMGLVVDAVDPEADRAAFPDADRVLTQLDAAGHPARAGGQTAAVVATMGRCDEEAIVAALALDPRYLGVVASRRRFAELRAGLLGRGVSAEALDRVRSPAGLDIGAHSPAEIALSILAELVKGARAAPPAATGAPASGMAAGEPSPSAPQLAREEATDPVCGMKVRVAAAKWTHDAGGERFYFCCPGCRDRFAADPERFTVSRRGGSD
jgi:xanthine dehydrogenase accessory factor